MDAEPKDIIVFNLRRYLEEYPSLRFCQALFGLNIFQMQPGTEHPVVIDPFYVTDEQVLTNMSVALKGKYKLNALPTYGTLYTIADFTEMCKMGGFINYDGFGRYATETQESNIEVRPSHITEKLIDLRRDEVLTHIIWFNR